MRGYPEPGTLYRTSNYEGNGWAWYALIVGKPERNGLVPFCEFRLNDANTIQCEHGEAEPDYFAGKPLSGYMEQRRAVSMYNARLRTLPGNMPPVPVL